MSHDEQVEHSVGHADAILIATLDPPSTEMVPVPNRPGIVHAENRVLVTPIKWLKGAPSRGPLDVRLGWYDLERVDEVIQEAGDQAILFLRRRTTDNEVAEWWINCSPNDYLGGIEKVPGAARQRVEQDVVSALHRLTLHGLSDRADLIVYGTSMGVGSDARPYGKPARCVKFRVVSKIRGGGSDSTVCVFTAVPGFAPEGEAVVFAKRCKDGSYEIVSGAGGVLDVDHGRVLRTGEPVRQFIEGLRDSLATWRTLR
jgi:hypothetical protein